LISDILDLSKIESGTVTVDAEEILTTNLLETVGRPFRHEADNRQLAFTIEVDPNLGRSMAAAIGGWSAEHPVLNQSPAVIAFEVSDTGIGIPLEKQKLIFEAFQ